MTVQIDPVRRLVIHTRSSRSHENLAVLTASVDAMNLQVAALRRGDYSLLQDLRGARGRNDQQFEDAMVHERKRMSEGFRRVAILVATQVGRLQIERLQQGEATPARVFLDEEEALRWLRKRD